MEPNQSFIMSVFYGWIVIFLLLVPASIGAYRRYLGISLGTASWLWLAALVLTVLSSPSDLYSSVPTKAPPGMPPPLAFVLKDFYLPRLALYLVVVPFVVKLYLKWVHNQVTEAEQKPGMEGVRAWLSRGNLVVALLLAFTAYWNDVPLMSVFVLAILALLTYPILKTVLQPVTPSEVVWEDLTAEREKVLSLVEQGKITADEAGELLTALGQTARPRNVRNGASTGGFASDAERWMTIGLGLVTVGAVMTMLNLPGIMQGRAGLSGNSGAIMSSLFGIMISALISAVGSQSRALNRTRKGLNAAVSIGLLGVGIFQLILIVFRSLPFPGVGVILMGAGFALLSLGLGRYMQINEIENHTAAQPPKI